MAQSVELLLDPVADDVLRRQWSQLADAGLPSAQRASQDTTHRPHITVFAAETIAPAAEPLLHEFVDGLDLDLTIGAVTVFGPRHGRCIVVRQVVASESLLRFQAEVAAVCRKQSEGHFAPGIWVPHVTLAHRVPTERLGEIVAVLGEHTTPTHVTECRRWDGVAKVAWLLGDRSQNSLTGQGSGSADPSAY